MTNERPILFSGAMVRAILDGRKTQTRRVVKPQPPAGTREVGIYHYPSDRDCFYPFDGGSIIGGWAQHCPYGQPGDRLWVRETWGFNPDFPGVHSQACYRADRGHEYDGIRWRPSIHMPRTACRLVLEVTGVRVERLQDISYEDAIAEGMFDPGTIDSTYPLTGETGEQLGRRLSHPQRSFAILWEELNGAGAWAANHWVWVVEFRRING